MAGDNRKLAHQIDTLLGLVQRSSNPDALAPVTAELATLRSQIGPMPSAQDLVQTNSNIVGSLAGTDPGTPLARRLGRIQATLEATVADLANTPPDTQAAVRGLERAVSRLGALVRNDDLLDRTRGEIVMGQLARGAWQLAVDAIGAVITRGSDSDDIREAQQAVADGDRRWSAGAFRP